jgi:hypothetical protein
MGVCDGSLIEAVFCADGDTISLLVLVFFVVDLRVETGEVNEAFFLRFFFAEGFSASGDVDMFKSTS